MARYYKCDKCTKDSKDSDFIGDVSIQRDYGHGNNTEGDNMHFELCADCRKLLVEVIQENMKVCPK